MKLYETVRDCTGVYGTAKLYGTVLIYIRPYSSVQFSPLPPLEPLSPLPVLRAGQGESSV